MAISAPRINKFIQTPTREQYGLTASGTIYQNCPVCLTDGDPDLAVAGADTSGFVFVGYADVANYLTDATTVNGLTKIHVLLNAELFQLTFSYCVSAAAFSFSAFPVDTSLYVLADGKLGPSAASTNKVRMGRLRRAHTKGAAGAVSYLGVWVVSSGD